MDEINNIKSSSSFLEKERQRVPSISSDDDEHSFVVLAKGSDSDFEDEDDGTYALPLVDNRKIHFIQGHVTEEISKISLAQQQQMKDTMPSTATSYSTESNEEIGRKVEELIKENEELKNTLEQNNLRMKAQCEKLEQWKANVNDSCTIYKNKLLEAKAAIDKQKEANLKLSEEVEKFKDIKILQDEEIIQLKNLLKAKDEHNNSSQSTSQQNWTDIEFEVIQNNYKDLDMVVKKLEKENSKLKEENHELKTRCEMRDEQYNVDQTTINELRKTLFEKEVQLEEMQRKYNMEINNLKTENEMMKEKLLLQVDTNTMLMGKCKSWEAEVNNLRDINTSLCSQVDNNLAEKYEQVRLQLMNAQKHLTDLEVELNSAHTEIVAKDEVINEMKSKVDEYDVLKTQLEVYQRDFDLEAQARRNLQTEKEQMQEDMANLLKRNHELQDIVENAREARVSPSRASSSSGESSSGAKNKKQESSSHGSPTSLTRYKCPICCSAYRSLKLLEEHIETCINNNP